ncbi:Arc family DNA-binding protein [Pseudoduganella sp. RAF53_2]|uniref:Arc family DNA-binding protein n=1 Tax=unclassified Pseudoduganella TaxID=2637179 RepID=UPI003F9499A0
MSRDISPFGLRMPADLKALLEKFARRNARSLNSEIVGRLNESVDAAQRPLRSYSDGELIRELTDRYERGMVSIRIGRPDDGA